MYGTQGGWGHCSGVSPLWLLIHNTIARTHTCTHTFPNNHTVAEGGGIEETIKYICPAHPPLPFPPPRWKLSTSVRTIDWRHKRLVAGSRWGQTARGCLRCQGRDWAGDERSGGSPGDVSWGGWCEQRDVLISQKICSDFSELGWLQIGLVSALCPEQMEYQ